MEAGASAEPEVEALFLGVDAGATRCRARLRTGVGKILSEAEGPAANIYVDFDRAVSVVRNVTAAALVKAGLNPRDAGRVSLGLGVAGLSSEAEAGRVRAALPGWAGVTAANDAIGACLGAHGGADGGLIIAGTGSAAAARVRGRDAIIGGRGFLLGDDGSAARIGADALRASLRAADGLIPSTSLTRVLMAHFSNDPLAMLNWALTAKSSDYGAFAPQVLAASAEGDAIGRPIVEAAARALEELAAALQRLGASLITMVGGLAEPIRPFLSPALAQALRPPLFDATDGAILIAGGVVPKANLERPVE
jgi:glucosamine kinase